MTINFYAEGSSLIPKFKRAQIKKWINQVTQSETCFVGDISFIFVDDEYLLKMNNDYLGHNYFTDIITFDYSEIRGSKRYISGDLFISLDTILSNSADYGVAYDLELRRVMIHGVLHLIGYKDKSDDEFLQMKIKEEHCLSLLQTIA